RHDVYLLLFGALALSSTVGALRAVGKRRGWLAFVLVLLSLLAQWGGFLSNEKGTVMPAILALLIIAVSLISLCRDEKRTFPVPAVLLMVGVFIVNTL